MVGCYGSGWCSWIHLGGQPLFDHKLLYGLVWARISVLRTLKPDDTRPVSPSHGERETVW